MTPTMAQGQLGLPQHMRHWQNCRVRRQRLSWHGILHQRMLLSCLDPVAHAGLRVQHACTKQAFLFSK